MLDYNVGDLVRLFDEHLCIYKGTDAYGKFCYKLLTDEDEFEYDYEFLNDEEYTCLRFLNKKECELLFTKENINHILEFEHDLLSKELVKIDNMFNGKGVIEKYFLKGIVNNNSYPPFSIIRFNSDCNIYFYLGYFKEDHLYWALNETRYAQHPNRYISLNNFPKNSIPFSFRINSAVLRSGDRISKIIIKCLTSSKEKKEELLKNLKSNFNFDFEYLIEYIKQNEEEEE